MSTHMNQVRTCCCGCACCGPASRASPGMLARRSVRLSEVASDAARPIMFSKLRILRSRVDRQCPPSRPPHPPHSLDCFHPRRSPRPIHIWSARILVVKTHPPSSGQIPQLSCRSYLRMIWSGLGQRGVRQPGLRLSSQFSRRRSLETRACCIPWRSLLICTRVFR